MAACWRHAKRNVSDLIKVTVPNIPKPDNLTPWRIEVFEGDNYTGRKGVARAIGYDGSVGVQWEGERDRKLQFIDLPSTSFRWIGPV